MAVLILLTGCAAPRQVESPTPISATATPLPTPVPRNPTVGLTPTASATSASVFAPVTPGDWAIGPAEARITLLAYCDFQSRGCAGLDRVLDRLALDHPGTIRRVFRHFPMALEHDKSVLAAEAVEAAGAQGGFWPMHDLLFERQDEWAAMSPDDFLAWLTAAAEELALDPARFGDDLRNHAFLARVDEAYRAAAGVGIPGAPFLLFDGEPYQAPAEHWALEALVRLELLKDRQFDAYPPQVIEPGRKYTAVVQTSRGEVTIELYPERAPLAVNSFVFLARRGWYDGTTFHHVLHGFMARAGDPTGTGLGGPGYAFENEISPSLRFDEQGVVAMFNVGPGTNGSQFFITETAQPNLTGNYTIFGRVVSGMEMVRSLTERNPEVNPAAPPGDTILSIVIREASP